MLAPFSGRRTEENAAKTRRTTGITPNCNSESTSDRFRYTFPPQPVTQKRISLPNQVSVPVGFTMLCALLLLTGCGGRDDLGQVRGNITLDGVPIENAYVRFTPKEKGSVSVGRTDSRGNYYLMFSRDVQGASLGEHSVHISTSDIGMDENGSEFHIREKIPPRYNQNSELVVTVDPGKNRHDFSLMTDDDDIPQPEILDD